MKRKCKKTTKRKVSKPLAALRHHVTGAIERGEREPIIEVPPMRRWEPVSRITFTPRTMPLSAEELAGLEIPEFLRR